VIDWVTLKVGGELVDPETVSKLRAGSGMVQKISADGEVVWQVWSRESIRSDSHQVNVYMGSALEIYGSPARACERSNVFGSGDVVQCARTMLEFVSRHANVCLPELSQWRCIRVDVTHNYDLGAAAQVREALMSLEHARSSRYQKTTDVGTVYWSRRSRMKSGKAYAKGKQLREQCAKGVAHAHEWELEAADRLLRLELSLKGHWWRQAAGKAWFDFEPSELESEHERYFEPLIGKAEVIDVDDLKAQLIEAAKRVAVRSYEVGVAKHEAALRVPGRADKEPEGLDARLRRAVGHGKSAYLYWLQIQQLGFETVRADTPDRTHYRHLQILREAGLSWSDFQARRIVPLRRRPLVLSQPVRSWDELRMVA
jgi:hypothetical protein